MLKFICSLTCTFIAAGAIAQPVLLPSIGLEEPPLADDQICSLPVQTPPLEVNGRPVGEAAADFQLYTIDGAAFHLEDALMQGRPVLMIAGSYTCPVFRNKILEINLIQQLYGDQISVVIIYTAEAHPHLDISPYFGVVNTHSANFAEGILYQQPTTFSERSSIVEDMLQAMVIDVPVLIDGPCNAWWNYYGPAPNIAYLLDVDGSIVSRHTWFDQYPQDMRCDIDALLGITNDCEEDLGGSFTMEWLTNDTVEGPSGSTVTVSTRIINPSSLPVVVEVHRLENNVPPGWSASLCLDVCYLAATDYAEVVVPAGGQQDFHYYFYTTEDPGYGHARVGVRNADDMSNSYMMNFHGISLPATSIGGPQGSAPQLQVWLDPSNGMVHMHVNGLDRIDVFDIQGRMVNTTTELPLDLGALAKGTYVLQVKCSDGSVYAPARIQLW